MNAMAQSRAQTLGDGPALLAVSGLTVRYGRSPALDAVSFDVPRQGITALLGPNGAGKTTALRAISGLLNFHGGWIETGSIALDGRALDSSPAGRVRAGIAQVMEGRRIFLDLTIEENLIAGSFTVPNAASRREALERVFALFPILSERRRETAGYLSGGQQQMVAIGRALMSSPRLLLLDEPSLGLAPKIVEQIAETILQINRTGTGILLVEQNAALALRIAHQATILETGKVALAGPAAELRENPLVRDVYLGMAGRERRSYRTAGMQAGDRP
jgi:branched-chain amino acid transport system ATP-binding protein